METTPRFYGRRKGKIIRKGRASAHDTVMPEIEIVLPKGDGWIDPKVFFAPRAPEIAENSSPVCHAPPFPEKEIKDVWLEIGFGNGEHLAYQALKNPDVGFIGCEPFVNGVAALCRDIRNNNIKNIRIWPEDARLFMPRLMEKSIGRCFLLNSDPWPKTRHHKRRFVQKETLDELHRVLKPGAEFRMSSDHASLTAWQVEKTYFHGGFSWNAHCAGDWRDRPEDLPETRYQKKGAGQGRATVFLSFKTR